MAGNAPPCTSDRGRCRGKAKVKSGCRTCKIRKIKCDETRPACRRCVSTGRICDGYGIWGGGANPYGSRQHGFKFSSVTCGPPASSFVLAASTEEKHQYEWFRCRTVKKIPGLFVSPFWDTLIHQASLSEPAVWHAVLTLSFLHKGAILRVNSLTRGNEFPNEQEQSVLQHYIKAIDHLQLHFAGRSKESVRTALITCVVFVCLDLLRGYFRTAQNHLETGLRILKEMQGGSDAGNDKILVLDTMADSVDEWILVALSRLQLQVELFNQTHTHSCFFLQASGLNPPCSVFRSLNEAWQPLERLLHSILQLADQSRQQRDSKYSHDQAPSTLLNRQRELQTELAEWLRVYKMSKVHVHKQDPVGFTYELLCSYHLMAEVMAGTCLSSADEIIYDSYSTQFLALLSLLIDVWRINLCRSDHQSLQGRRLDMDNSVIGMGWIPPLYYTALKCRVHRLRLQAIRLLEMCSHREGIWDSNISACVAWEVMKIEERDFYKDLNTNDDFLVASRPEPKDLSLPLLPKSYRVDEVQVLLSDGHEHGVALYCQYKRQGEDGKPLLEEYYALLQPWKDEVDDCRA